MFEKDDFKKVFSLKLLVVLAQFENGLQLKRTG